MLWTRATSLSKVESQRATRAGGQRDLESCARLQECFKAWKEQAG